MGHNGSPYDDVIHVALIACDCASLITSFQPPLSLTSLHVLIQVSIFALMLQVALQIAFHFVNTNHDVHMNGRLE